MDKTLICLCVLAGLALASGRSQTDELPGKWRFIFARGWSNEMLADIGLNFGMDERELLKSSTGTFRFIKLEGDYWFFHVVVDNPDWANFRPPMGPIKVPGDYHYENPSFTQNYKFSPTERGILIDATIEGSPLHYTEEYYVDEDGYLIQYIVADTGRTQKNYFYRIEDYREGDIDCSQTVQMKS